MDHHSSVFSSVSGGASAGFGSSGASAFFIPRISFILSMNPIKTASLVGVFWPKPYKEKPKPYISFSNALVCTLVCTLVARCNYQDCAHHGEISEIHSHFITGRIENIQNCEYY